MASSGRPRKACSTCKAQKIRCTEERPICKRCARLRHTCVYDATPKSQKGNRVIKRLHEQSQPTPVAECDLDDTLSTPQFHPSCPGPSSSDLNLGIPPSLLLNLIEVYYQNVYNATLLFHKQTFLDSLSAGTIRPHIILSICAFAAKFYRDAAGQATLQEHGFMDEWAKRAGKLVFQEAEELHEDNVATFINLALFWHAEGSWRVALLHKGNACQLLHAVGLGSKRLQTEISFEAEVRRRRFWACYLMHCHLGENTQPFEPWVMKKMALPWPENDFKNKSFTGTQASIEESAVSGEGVFEEMAKVITLWARVSSLVRLPCPTFNKQIAAIYTIDHELKQWWNRLPSSLRLNADGDLPCDEDLVPKILLINIFYHQSLCVLHSSLVPIYSWSTQTDMWPGTVFSSAQIAYDQACEVSELLSNVIKNYPRLSAMPSFISYAAYCGCAIQIPFMSSTDDMVRRKAELNVETNVKMIEIMANYWKIASILRFYVEYLIKVHEKMQIKMAGEPKNCDISTLTSFRTNAIRTRTSILEFMGILRPDGGGYVKPGDECDLQADAENDDTELPSRASEQIGNIAVAGPSTPLDTGGFSSDMNSPATLPLLPDAQANNVIQSSQSSRQYKPELLSFLGLDSSGQLDLGIDTHECFNPFLDLQPLSNFYFHDSPEMAQFTRLPNLDYFETQ